MVAVISEFASNNQCLMRWWSHCKRNEISIKLNLCSDKKRINVTTVLHSVFFSEMCPLQIASAYKVYAKNVAVLSDAVCYITIISNQTQPSWRLGLLYTAAITEAVEVMILTYWGLSEFEKPSQWLLQLLQNAAADCPNTACRKIKGWFSDELKYFKEFKQGIII